MFKKKTFYLSKTEYAKICDEISTNYGMYEGRYYCVHLSFGIDNIAYAYYFENLEYGEYNIYMRVEID